jgi:aspartate aminotransferase
MLGEYQRRADHFIPALNAIPGVACSRPDGAFYAFPNVKGLMKNFGFATSKAVAEELLYKYGVVVTDGAAFGAEGYLRMSYANSLEAIQEAVARMKQMVVDRAK